MVKKVLQKTTIIIWVSQKQLPSQYVDYVFQNGLEILHATTLERLEDFLSANSDDVVLLCDSDTFDQANSIEHNKIKKVFLFS